VDADGARGAGLWWHVNAACGEVGGLIGDLPDGDNGYELMPESVQELLAAKILLVEAAEILDRTGEREVERYERWCDEHAALLDQEEMSS
jgi:hypothetical protein